MVEGPLQLVTSVPLDDLKIDSLITKIVEINFGRIQTNNKILLILKYKEVNKGEIKVNFDMACYLN